MTLPKLPPSVEAEVLLASSRIVRAMQEAGLGVAQAVNTDVPSPELYSVLYLLKLYALQQLHGAPGEESYHITLSEIAAVLETIGRMMASDGAAEYVGYDARWFTDAADIVTRAERDMVAQMEAVEKLLSKGLGAGDDNGL